MDESLRGGYYTLLLTPLAQTFAPSRPQLPFDCLRSCDPCHTFEDLIYLCLRAALPTSVAGERLTATSSMVSTRRNSGGFQNTLLLSASGIGRQFCRSARSRPQ